MIKKILDFDNVEISPKKGFTSLFLLFLLPIISAFLLVLNSNEFHLESQFLTYSYNIGYYSFAIWLVYRISISLPVFIFSLVIYLILSSIITFFLSLFLSGYLYDIYLWEILNLIQYYQANKRFKRTRTGFGSLILNFGLAA